MEQEATCPLVQNWLTISGNVLFTSKEPLDEDSWDSDGSIFIFFKVLKIPF